MKVIDLYKQLEILLQSGQEDLQVMISTSADYVPLEVVEIEDDKCCLCDRWTPGFDNPHEAKKVRIHQRWDDGE